MTESLQNNTIIKVDNIFDNYIPHTLPNMLNVNMCSGVQRVASHLVSERIFRSGGVTGDLLTLERDFIRYPKKESLSLRTKLG